MITDKDVVPALASVGFNRYTTFGWVLPRPDLGGWQDSGSFSTHANVETKKPAIYEAFFNGVSYVTN